MGRPSRFSDDQVLDAAREAISQVGPRATVEDVARLLGCQAGAVYYRFPSRQVLMLRLWVRSVRRFQARFLDALREADPTTALVAGACTIPDYCRELPDEARALVLFRQQRVLAGQCPDDVRPAVAGLNVELTRTVDSVIERRYGRCTEPLRLLVRAAVQETPYGLVRPYIGGDGEIPGWLTEVVRTSTPAVLALGDDPGWPSS